MNIKITSEQAKEFGEAILKRVDEKRKLEFEKAVKAEMDTSRNFMWIKKPKWTRKEAEDYVKNATYDRLPVYNYRTLWYGDEVFAKRLLDSVNLGVKEIEISSDQIKTLRIYGLIKQKDIENG